VVVVVVLAVIGQVSLVKFLVVVRWRSNLCLYFLAVFSV
jgi:hypothetical protein